MFDHTIAEIPTLFIAILVLFLGYRLTQHIPVLNRLNLPDPVVGGVFASTALLVVHLVNDLTVTFSNEGGDYLMLAFFSTVGLSASFKMLMRGGLGLLIFIGICFVFLIIQNILGTSLALAMGMDPRIGLLAGSVTLSGGHGTGKVYADLFAAAATPLPDALGIAMACATFGLIIGGVMGGPVSQLLIRRNNLSPTKQDVGTPSSRKLHQRRYEEEETVCTETMLQVLFAIFFCMMLGMPLSTLFESYGITLPTFVPVLFIGIIVRNLLDLLRMPKAIPNESLTVVGNIALAIFLAVAMMNIKLWQLASLAGPLAVMMIAQTVVTFFFTYYITFRAMGSDYDAAVIAGGHCGFGMGSTPTAIANMDAVVRASGPAPRAFLIVPLVGAFSIDICNAIVIQIFMALPWFAKLTEAAAS